MIQRQQLQLTGALAVVLLLIALLSVFANRGPEITGVDPQSAGSGDVVTIRGRGFGSEYARIQLGGNSVPSANIREWADTRIRFSVPGAAYTGLVQVAVQGKTSNTTLFTNSDSVPVASGREPAAPFVFSVSPNVAEPGREVTVSGRNFGVSSAAGRILLRPESDEGADIDMFPPEYELPAEYISMWSTDTIRFYAPSGIVADEVIVETLHGSSDSSRFELQDLVGTYRYSDPVEIAFGLRMQLQVRQSDESEASRQFEGVEDELVVWMPGVPEGPAQRSRSYTRVQPEPRYRTPELLQFVFSKAEVASRERLDTPSELLRLHAGVTRYRVETTLLPSQISRDYSLENPVYRDYMRSAQGIVVSDDLRSRARTLGGRSSNPLTIARTLFAGVRQELAPDVEEPAGSRDYAQLLAGLLRARDIPARLVTGILLPPGHTPRYHHWVEWYALDFGWVPMDPYAADAAAAGLEWAVALGEDPDYFSENLDPFRAALHTGGSLPPRQDQFSVFHPVQDIPLLTSSGVAYGHLSGLELELQWLPPLVMYRQSR